MLTAYPTILLFHFFNSLININNPHFTRTRFVKYKINVSFICNVDCSFANPIANKTTKRFCSLFLPILYISSFWSLIKNRIKEYKQQKLKKKSLKYLLKFFFFYCYELYAYNFSFGCYLYAMLYILRWFLCWKYSDLDHFQLRFRCDL